MSAAPIFIIGTERSGSNLVRAILNAHSRIVVPHPPHIVRYFAPLEGGYGDLARDANFAQLVDDILTLVRLHIHPWGIAIDRARVLREAEPRDAFGVFVALYEQYREAAGKPRWGCKSTFLIDYTDRILRRFPDARLLLLTRDARDVVVSSRQSVFNPFHPYFTAELWARQQRTALTLRATLPAETLMVLRYEDLLADAPAQVRRVCAFLGEPFEAAMLRFFETAAAKETGALSESWKNTARPIITDNSGRFRKLLSGEEIALVEGVAGDAMTAFGYALDDPSRSPAAVTRRARMRYRLLDLQLRLGVELRSLFNDRNHWRRWARDLWVTYLRVRRGARR